MVVHGPAADGHRVVEVALQQIVLREDVIAQHPPAPAPPRHHADPVQREIGAAGKLAAVLDVVPHAHHDGEQLEADALVVADGIDVAAPLDPRTYQRISARQTGQKESRRFMDIV